MTGKKTDNNNLAAKLSLRSYFLRKHHTDGANVMDCCQGDGVVWSHLRRTHFVASYWGMDVKKKKGRLQIDSSRVLAQPGWTQDVIDIDTYGSPWRHWLAMVPNVVRPLTVFLTIGQVLMGTDATVRDQLGLRGLDPPQAIMKQLQEMALMHLLAGDKRIRIVEAMEAPRGTHARYIGVRVIPA